MSFDQKYIALRCINDSFTNAKTMLYEPQNNAFFDKKDAFYLSFQRLIIEKQLIINQLTKHRHFSIFLTTSKTFSKNAWKLNQNYEITWQSNNRIFSPRLHSQRESKQKMHKGQKKSKKIWCNNYILPNISYLCIDITVIMTIKAK